MSSTVQEQLQQLILTSLDQKSNPTATITSRDIQNSHHQLNPSQLTAEQYGNAILGVLKRLSSRGAITFVTQDSHAWILTAEGQDIANKGSYELRVLQAIPSSSSDPEASTSVAELNELLGGAENARIGINNAFKLRWIAKSKGAADRLCRAVAVGAVDGQGLPEDQTANRLRLIQQYTTDGSAEEQLAKAVGGDAVLQDLRKRHLIERVKESLQLICFKTLTLYLKNRSSLGDTTKRIRLNHSKVNLMTNQVTNVVNVVLDHGRPFQTQTPSNDTDTRRKSHRLKHLRPKDTRVADFHPSLHTIMISKDFHGWFGVRIEGWLEAKFLESQFTEEGVQDTNQITQSQTIINDQAFNLMKFGQVSGIQTFIPKDSIDGKVLDGTKDWFLGQAIQHAAADGGGVGAQNVLGGFLGFPGCSVAETAGLGTAFMSSLDLVGVVQAHVAGLRIDSSGRLLQEEGVMSLTAWMLLRLEQSVKIPEGAFNEAVRRHFLKAHFNKDLAKLFSDLQQRMQMTRLRWHSINLQVVLLELQVLPTATGKHVNGQVSGLISQFDGESRTTADDVKAFFDSFNQVSLAQVLQHSISTDSLGQLFFC